MALTLLCATMVSAHAPLATEVWSNDNTPVPTVRLPGFGIIARAPGTDSHGLLCNSLLGIAAPDPTGPMLAMPSGDLLIGTDSGLLRFFSPSCSLGRPELGNANETGLAVIALASPPGSRDEVYALTHSATSGLSYLSYSADAGMGWRTLSRLPEGVFPTTIAVANGTPATVVLSDAHPSHAGQVLTSVDGGATFQISPCPAGLHVLQVQQGTPLRTWARVPNNRESVIVRREGVAGAFEEVHRLQYFGGLAADPHSGRVWLGEAIGGVWLSQDGGASFTAVAPELAVGCLHYDADRDALWACTAGLPSQPAMSVSNDGGNHWTDSLTLDSVTALADCPKQVKIEDRCAGAWAEWQADVLSVRTDRQVGVAKPRDGSVPTVTADAGDHGSPRTDAGQPDASQFDVRRDDAGASASDGAVPPRSDVGSPLNPRPSKRAHHGCSVGTPGAGRSSRVTATRFAAPTRSTFPASGPLFATSVAVGLWALRRRTHTERRHS